MNTSTHIYCCKIESSRGKIAAANECQDWCKNGSIKKYKFCGICEFFYLGNPSNHSSKPGQFPRHNKCKQPKDFARGDLRKRAVRNIPQGEPVADGYYFIGEAKSDAEYINDNHFFLLEEQEQGLFAYTDLR